jgi:tetratricopeptide (TPR) repeat protein/predicted ATPase
VADNLKLSSWCELLTDKERESLDIVLPPNPESDKDRAFSRPAPLSRLFQLPAAIADFTGREEERRRLASLVRDESGKVGLSAVRGMGGIGKTTLAVQVAHDLKGSFPDAQLIIDLEGTSATPLTPAEVMARIIRDFHPDVANLPDSERDLLLAYRSVLAGRRALIVFDNAKDEEQVKPLVSAPSPVGFIVTSRNTLGLDGLVSISLDALHLGEAMNLLRRIVGERGTNDELQTLAQICGRLPLALRVAGDYLRLHENWSMTAYIGALKDEDLRLRRLVRKQGRSEVEHVLALSAQDLVRNNKEQAERWQLLSVFPSEFDLSAAATVWNMEANGPPRTTTAEDELTSLLERSLVQFDPASGRYSLHDLMRPVAQRVFDYCQEAKCTSDLDALWHARCRFATHYSKVLLAADQLYIAGKDGVLKGLSLFDLEATNIRAGWRWSCDNWQTHRDAAELCRDYPDNGFYIITLRILAQDRKIAMEQAVKACRHIGDRKGEGTSFGYLGMACCDLAEMQAAMQHHQQHLTIARELGDRHGEAYALGNIGNVLTHVGDTQLAMTTHKHALQLLTNLGDGTGEVTSLVNLGLDYSLIGDVTAAITVNADALQLAKQSGDLRLQAQANVGLGVAYYKLQQFETAIGQFQEALRMTRIIVDRQEERLILKNIATSHWAQQNLSKAIEVYKQRLAIDLEVLDMKAYAVDCLCIADLLKRLNGTAEAMRYAELAIPFLESIRDGLADAVRRTIDEWRNDSLPNSASKG